MHETQLRRWYLAVPFSTPLELIAAERQTAPDSQATLLERGTHDMSGAAF
jgi:hypothetical protein